MIFSSGKLQTDSTNMNCMFSVVIDLVSLWRDISSNFIKKYLRKNKCQEALI